MKRIFQNDQIIRSQPRLFLQNRSTSASATNNPNNEPWFSRKQVGGEEEGGGGKILSLVKDKMNKVMMMYEDFIGITQVKEAQNLCIKAETSFKSSQQHRRAAQEKLAQVQNQLRVLRMDIDRTARGDHRYLELIKNEIVRSEEEREFKSNFEELEERERELFSELSNTLRMSHAKERAQGEKTKYFSLFGSLFGAFLGILGTTFNTRMRHEQTKSILLQTSSHVSQIEESVKNLSNKLGVNGGGPVVNNNTPENLVQLLNSVQEHQKLLQISRDTLKSFNKTVESMAAQLHRNNSERVGNNSTETNPLYFDLSKITPENVAEEKVAVVLVTMLLIGIGVIFYSWR